jgi:hypothetical protein
MNDKADIGVFPANIGCAVVENHKRLTCAESLSDGSAQVDACFVAGFSDPTFPLLRFRRHEARGILRVCDVSVELWC